MSQRVDIAGCAEVLERLDAWVDGELDEALAAAVAAHIDDCESCRREWLLAQEVVEELRAMQRFELPQRVLAAAHAENTGTVMPRPAAFFDGVLRRPLPTLAAVAVVVVMVVLAIPWRTAPRAQYSDREVSRAASDVRLAFAYVDAISRRAEVRIRAKVFDQDVAAQTVRGVRRSFQMIGGVGGIATSPPATPQPRVKGS